MAKGLSSWRMGDVYLNNWAGKGGKGVSQGNRGVCIATRIDQNPIAFKTIRLQTINQPALIVALEIVNAVTRKISNQAGKKVIK
jgi:hypothetical protein